jgi:hypothetical protein
MGNWIKMHEKGLRQSLAKAKCIDAFWNWLQALHSIVLAASSSFDCHCMKMFLGKALHTNMHEGAFGKAHWISFGLSLFQ